MIAAHCRLFSPSLSVADVLSSVLIAAVLFSMLTNRLGIEARIMRRLDVIKTEAVAINKEADRIDRLVARAVY